MKTHLSIQQTLNMKQSGTPEYKQVKGKPVPLQAQGAKRVSGS